jgi:hypothetical protein
MSTVESDRSVTVPLDQIDDGLQPARQMRLELDEEAIEHYVENLPQLPPVKLMWDDTEERYWVVDGAHTLSAAAKLGNPEVRAIVTNGGYLEAFAAAAKCNGQHGVRVTNADKRHRVEVALAHAGLKKWSNRRLSDLCGVDDKTVGRLRSASTAEIVQLPTVGRDGRGRMPWKKAKAGLEEEPEGNGKAAAPAPPGDDDGPVELAAAVRIAEEVVRDEYVQCSCPDRPPFLAAIRGVCDNLEEIERDLSNIPDVED